MKLSIVLIVCILVSHISATTCDSLVAPTNGGTGFCWSNAMASGQFCEPSCNSGFILSGVHSCLNGVLTEATCFAVGSCSDTTNFVDAQNRDCAFWANSNCYHAHYYGGYSYADLTDLVTGCCQSCNTCLFENVAPLNGAVGNCVGSLSSNGSCAPVCNTGYTPSGTTVCNNGAIISLVVCVDDSCTNNDSVSDLYEDTCSEAYDSDPAYCTAEQNDNDFDAFTHCCVCAANLGNACPITTPPVNGSMGDCPSILAHTGECQPTCDTGYALYDSTYYCEYGVMLGVASCQLQPCDATAAPTNGGQGMCPNSLLSGEYCLPSCAGNFFLSAGSYCMDGTLTPGTCIAAGSCNDNVNFVDVHGQSCSDWVDLDCYDYTLHFNYSRAELNNVISECCLTCNTCNTSVAPINGTVGTCNASMLSGDTCEPACNTGFTVSDYSWCNHGVVTEPVCVDNTCVDDNSTTNIDGDTCSYYDNTDECEMLDDSDFTAFTQCCICIAATGNACTINTPTNGSLGTDCPLSILSHGFHCFPVCNSGYTSSGALECSYGTLSTFTCTANACTATEVANSDKSTTDVITGNTGDVVAVVCDTGYSGSGDATCGTDGTFSTVTCAANPCTATEVADSDKSTTGDITGNTGDVVAVACNNGFSTSGDVTCGTDGNFSVITCVADCDASVAPENGLVGTCTASLLSGATCEPTCVDGYNISGASTCTEGVLTPATCIAISTTPAATTTASISILYSGLWMVCLMLIN